MKVNNIKDELVKELANRSEIKGIAQTGDINAPLVPGNSDIDIFVLCTEVPSKEEREGVYHHFSKDYSELSMNVCNGGIWGYGDILMIDGIDVMFMYFTIDEMADYVNEVMSGKHLDKDWGFYPTGRLSSIENISVLYEEGKTWTSLIEKVKTYPDSLFDALYHYHMDRVINDEDLGRVKLRHEVLFYHGVLEDGLDHLLQAIFALNHTYFPSRKRSEKYIREFAKKPVNCYERLLKVIEFSVVENKIDESVDLLKSLHQETAEIGRMV